MCFVCPRAEAYTSTFVARHDAMLVAIYACLQQAKIAGQAKFFFWLAYFCSFCSALSGTIQASARAVATTLLNISTRGQADEIYGPPPFACIVSGSPNRFCLCRKFIIAISGYLLCQNVANCIKSQPCHFSRHIEISPQKSVWHFAAFMARVESLGI
jgi:hypothetical protein